MTTHNTEDPDATQSEGAAIETRSPDDLTPHPRSDEIYDDEAEDWFVQSVEEQGVIEPIVITDDSHFESGEVIVSGHRRTDAAKKAGLDEVPIRLEEYDSELEEREVVIEYNKQREKAFSQKMREADELMEIETEKARKRMQQGGKGTQNLDDLPNGRARDKVAERFDRSGEWLRQAQKVWEYAKDGNSWVQDYVESIDDEDDEKSESVNSAYKAVRRQEILADIDDEGRLPVSAKGGVEPEGELMASFSTSVSRLDKLLRQTALKGETSHHNLYLEVLADRNGEVRFLQSAPGEVILSYCSYYVPYLDQIELEQEGPVAAIIDVGDARKRLESVGSDAVRVELRGVEKDEPIASGIRLASDYETWVPTPTSEEALEGVPEWLPSRFNDQNVFTNTEGDTAPTIIDTEVSEVEKIIWAVKNTEDQNVYPLVVEDEEFRLQVDGDESYLRGLLAATVDGPDIESCYFDGFEEIFESLTGPVELQTAPRGNPVAVVQKEHGKVIRHINGSMSN